MSYQGKHCENRRLRLPVLGAVALLLIVVLSLCFGGVFGDELTDEPEQTAATLTAADYLSGSYVQIDREGNVFTDQELFVLRLAEEIGGESVTALQENCLRGSSRISAVIVPACITEIGDNAFADCENLEAVIFEGRADTEGMTLGENWNGGAALLFALAVETEATSGDTPEEPDGETPEEMPGEIPEETDVSEAEPDIHAEP